MGKVMVVIIVGAVAWFLYANWDGWTEKPTRDNYVGKEYKKSLDKAREVEDIMQQQQEKLQQAQP